MMANPAPHILKRIQLRPVKSSSLKNGDGSSSSSKQNRKSHLVAIVPRPRHPNSNLPIGAPLGSHNYMHGRRVKQAFVAELAKVWKKKGRADTQAGLERLAGKVISWALRGSLPAAREVFDRVDGRPAQTIIGDPENPIFFKPVAEMSDEELEQVARGVVINGTAERVD